MVNYGEHQHGSRSAPLFQRSLIISTSMAMAGAWVITWASSGSRISKLSFGATFRSSADLNFRGNTDFRTATQALPQSDAARCVDADFTFPLTAVFGVSYRPTPKWNLEFDANYTDWSSFGTVTIEQSPPPVSNPLDQNIPVNLDWQASWMYEFGVTRYFDNGWHVERRLCLQRKLRAEPVLHPAGGGHGPAFLQHRNRIQGKNF